MSQHEVTGRLKPRAPFDFDKNIDFAGSFSPAMGEQKVANRTLTKATSIDGQVVAFRVRSVGTVEEPEIEYTLISDEPISESVKEAAADRIGFYLSTDDDLQPFYDIASEDKAFRPVLAKMYGHHQVKFITPFEAAAWAVLSQRNPIAVARKVKDKIKEQYGGQIVVDGEVYQAFPEAEVIASVPEEDLFKIVKNEKRTAYLRAVASAFSTADEDFLRHGPYKEVEAWLKGIKGIGAWSAAFVLLRSLGHMDCLPLEESRASGVVARVYNGGAPVDDAYMRGVAEKYGPYVGYWTYYLRVAG